MRNDPAIRAVAETEPLSTEKTDLRCVSRSPEGDFQEFLRRMKTTLVLVIASRVEPTSYGMMIKTS